jgi:K+-transporting ATPase KdpF subunit
MSTADLLALIVTAILCVYLFYALIRGEKF